MNSKKTDLKVCGIVCEYNPFHNGHQYQIEQAKKITNCDVVICVMSGFFVQRGEPSIIPPLQRAKAAISNGADVIIQLPYLYSTQSAEQFAHGAINILKQCHIDYLCFGSECGDLQTLKNLVNDYSPFIKEDMKNGDSYAYIMNKDNLNSNDILALCYLKEIKDTNIEPILIQRTNEYTSLEVNEVASAMAIRKAIKDNTDYSFSTPMDKESFNNPVYLDMFYAYIRTTLLMTPSNELKNIFLFNEGIENHLKKCAEECDSLETFLNSATTHRYSTSRIRRCLIQMMMHFTYREKEQLETTPYIHVLAFNDAGRNWLKTMREDECVVCNRFNMIPLKNREIEYRSVLLYTSVLQESKRKEILKEFIQGSLYVR